MLFQEATQASDMYVVRALLVRGSIIKNEQYEQQYAVYYVDSHNCPMVEPDNTILLTTFLIY